MTKLNVMVKAIMDMMRIYNRGYHLYTVHFFTSIAACDFLLRGT